MVAVPGGTPGTLLVIGPVHVPLKENGGGGVGVGAVGDELPPPHAAVIHSAKTAMLRWIRILEVILEDDARGILAAVFGILAKEAVPGD